MTVLVCFHAHPDDEAIATGGLMALAADAGHDVVLVVATRGELGEPRPGVLAPGESLDHRREAESHRCAEILGAGRVEFLGYRDSGMMGEPTNDDPASFWQADVQAAARRLAGILDDCGADVVTVYDERGSYGHPDHIQVHRVGAEAAALHGGIRVLESVINRDFVLRRSAEFPDVEDHVVLDNPDFGVSEHRITHAIDVGSVIDRKRRAMQAHESQIGDDSFFLAMPPEVFTVAFGTEWFIDPRRPRHSTEPFFTGIEDLVAGADDARSR